VNTRTLDLIPIELFDLYEFHEWRNAIAVLNAAYPDEWSDVLAVLSGFRLLRTDIEKDEAGGRFGDRSKVVIRLDDIALRPRGCPVLIVGMKKSLYLDDVADPSVGSRFVRIVRATKLPQKTDSPDAPGRTRTD
jgi:hypothetical protein